MSKRSCSALALLFAVACARSSDVAGHGRHPWTLPGVLRIATISEPSALDPVLDAESATFDIAMFVYSWTVRYDDKARPIPDALRELPTVANGDVSKDGLTLRYKLRRNATWQDGAALTCRDLAFTWRVVMNPHNNVVVTDGYKDIRSIDCSDPFVAVIHMKRLYAPYLQQLWSINGNAPILPEHLLAKYNDAKGSFNSAPYNALPIGSGPFRIAAWERGQEIRLVANPRFYLGRPKLNEVVFKIVPDENTAAEQLQTHEIDLLAATPRTWLLDEATAADPHNGLATKIGDSFTFGKLDLNLRNPILSDRRVRVALAYATDRAGLVASLLHGLGVLAETDQHPRLSWAYTSDVTHYPYDPQTARTNLDRDGWKAGADGMRSKNGRPLEIALNAANGARPSPGELIIQREWRDVGVKADIKNYQSTQFYANSPEGIIQGGRYDVADLGFVNAADPDDSASYSADNFAPRGQNSTFWSNAKATAAINDALRTVDQQRRRRDYVIVQQQLAQDVPSIILYFARIPYLYNSDLRGFDPSPVVSPYWNPWAYSI